MILLISTCSDKLSEDEFVRSISETVNIGFFVKHYSALNTGNIDKSSKIIICGTALMDNEYLNHLEAFDFLKNIRKPILGICSGMQIIALQFGAKIKREKEIGMIKISSASENKLFSGEFEAYALHGNGLTDLDKFDIIAKSGKGVQAIKHKKKEIYGVMFHPEVRNSLIIKKFIS